MTQFGRNGSGSIQRLKCYDNTSLKMTVSKFCWSGIMGNYFHYRGIKGARFSRFQAGDRFEFFPLWLRASNKVKDLFFLT